MHEGHSHIHEGESLSEEHNRKHAEELRELAHTLEHQGQYEAASLIIEAVNYFSDGNDKLEAALEQITEED